MASFVCDEWSIPPASVCSGAVTIGNFDGVHRGHAALLAETRRLAQAVGGPAVAITFDPHPLQILRPEQFQPVLTTVADRAALLEAAGADHVIQLRTTAALLHLRAEEFFETVLRDHVAARAVIEGTNFGFGRDREGDVQTLARLCARAGMQLSIVPPVMHEGQPISSSRVRRALLQGAVGEATLLCGHPYFLRAKVGRGAGRGRTIGFPTANLEPLETLVPGDGVYAVRVHLGGEAWAGAANIGPNPTFAEQQRKIEVHLIGFAGDLVGQSLRVDFIAWLRGTRPFASVAALVEQLHQDIDQARRLVQRVQKEGEAHAG